MSKEHAYAYEAGYRDGSINYELEHCPACKNVADLQEALEENAKLREEIEAAKHDLQVFSRGSVQLEAENAKLRELAEGLMGHVKHPPCEGCIAEMNCDCSDLTQCDEWLFFEADARDLGIEVP